MLVKTLAESVFDNILCGHIHWSDVMYFKSIQKSMLCKAWDTYNQWVQLTYAYVNR